MNKENLRKITDLRHELHMYPELSMQERETAERIKTFLQDNTHFRIVDRGDWFYAFKEGRKPGQKIAFRADMDALPIAEDDALSYHSRNAGVSHKCGHDGHCAALCGLALELDAKETDSDIYLIFQPGEETGSGALFCRELIREEGITRIFAFHNLGGYQEGSIVYRCGLTQPASEGLRICFEGKASHASAPEEGMNPSGVIARVILRAEELAQDQSDGMLLCTIKRFGLRTSHSIHDYFPETRNDEQCLEAAIRAASQLGMNVISMEDIWRASEDFGWYLKECPGAIIYIGSGEDYPPLHTVAYDFNDRILENAVDLFTALAENYETHLWRR